MNRQILTRPVKGIAIIPGGGVWAVDKGRVVVFDSNYKSTEPIKINAAAKPACLALTKENQVITIKVVQ